MLPTVLTTPEQIEAYRRLALFYALRIEVRTGLKSRNNPYKRIKQEFNIHGNKANVLAQYEAMLRKEGLLPKENT